LFRKIACIGGGTIGRSWALLFALRGYDVNLYDLSDDILIGAGDYIKRWLESSTRKGTMKEKQLEQITGKIKLTSSLMDAVEDVDYVQESVPENLGLKKQVFSKVSSLTKHSTILASSTSGLSMTEIQKAALSPEMCITVHPINPPHLIPLVEIVPGNRTREDVVKTVYDFMSELQKTPIIVEKEFPGFVFNRLAAALWREALDLLDKGVATVEDIDKAVHAGMGLRWAITGPFLTYHLGGGEDGLEYFIDHLGPAFSAWWKSMANWTSIPHSAAKKAVDGVKQMDIAKEKTYEELVEWRDKKLMKLLEALGS
jgi:3-hydroxypropionate dehydrogenase (NADP+)